MTRRQTLTAAAAWLLAFLFLDTINATSVLMERARQGPPVAAWEPFTWEYSSGAATLLLIPLIVALERRVPFVAGHWAKPALVHALLTLPFSLLHVGMMVGMRKAVYALQERTYDFGNVPVELLYEYRKDFVTYFLIVGVIYAWRNIGARRRGASYEAGDAGGDAPQFLLRSRGRVQRVAADDIDWVEAAGNYVLLHVGKATHPLRDTMKGIEERLGRGFCRVHRSTLVNLERVQRTRRAGGGELVLRLRDGTELGCSRTHRDALHAGLERLATVRGASADDIA